MEKVEQSSEASSNQNETVVTKSLQDEVPALEHIESDVMKRNIDKDSDQSDNTASVESSTSQLITTSVDRADNSESSKNRGNVSECIGNVSTEKENKASKVKLESFCDAVPINVDVKTDNGKEGCSERKADGSKESVEIADEMPLIKPSNRGSSLHSFFTSNTENQSCKDASPFLMSGALEGGLRELVCINDMNRIINDWVIVINDSLIR